MEQRPDDTKPGAVGEEFEHVHRQLNLLVGGVFIYLRSHVDKNTLWSQPCARCPGSSIPLFGTITPMSSPAAPVLLRRGLRLEYTTLCWNVIGVVVLVSSAIAARSVALAGFGLDSLIEIGASTVVIWELRGSDDLRQQRALRLIGGAFALVAVYLLVQGVVVLATHHHAGHSISGVVWTALTAVAMFSLAWGKARTGHALGNVVLETEGQVTLIDGILATAVLVGLTLNAALGWWWADPVAGFVLVYYAGRECLGIFHHEAPT